MLTLTEVHTYYGKSHILLGVSLEVQPGEVVGLLGRNGVGKSTTLKTIMGLVRPSGGHVRFEGREIAGTAPHRLAHAGLAWVPEDRRIFRLLSVMENLEVGAYARRDGGLAEDLEQVFAAAKKHGKAIEINSYPQRLDLKDVHARRAAELGIPIAISTDTHYLDNLDYMALGIATARRAWITKTQVLNALPLKKLLAWAETPRR